MRRVRRLARIGSVLASALLMATPMIAHAEPAAPVDAAARAGLVDVHGVLPDAIVDLRYGTADNFLGVRLYPADARCLVHESLVAGLIAAAKVLRAQGNRLVFWDCYRPHEVQVRMFEVVPDPSWVARPGTSARSHTAARSVDVTLSDATGRLLDMGTDFDEFSPRALAYATDGVAPAAQANRARLRDAMAAGGFTVYDGEWWHFDGSGADTPRPLLDVPLS